LGRVTGSLSIHVMLKSIPGYAMHGAASACRANARLRLMTSLPADALNVRIASAVGCIADMPASLE